MIYAEITRSGKDPVFVQLLNGVAVGESHNVAVMDSVRSPELLAGLARRDRRDQADSARRSTKRWRSIATAESWNGNRAVLANRFGFRLDGVAVAGATGGSWRAFQPGARFLIGSMLSSA